MSPDPGSRNRREPVRKSHVRRNRNYTPQPEHPVAPPAEMVQDDFKRAKSKS